MSNSYPLVSIIIPTYNQEKKVAKTIESALAQDYLNLEVIIADDCSTDNTAKIATSYIERYSQIKYFCNDRNLGRVGNYRKALYEYAKGNYALNLDGDDLLTDPTFISSGINSIIQRQKQGHMIVFLSACKVFVSPERIFSRIHKINTKELCISGLDYLLGLHKKYYFSHLTTIYNRDIALNNEFYRYDIISSDLESFGRLALQGDVILVKEVVGQWNDTGTNESKTLNLKKQIQNIQWVNSVSKELKNQTSPLKHCIWKYKAKTHYSRFIVRAIRDGAKLDIDNLKEIYQKKMILPIISFISINAARKLMRLFRKR